MKSILIATISVLLTASAFGQLIITAPVDANPSGVSGVSSYILNTKICQEGSLNHCIQVSGTGSNYSIASFNASSGTILPVAGTCFNYTAAPGFSGVASLFFTLQNNLGETANLTVSIEVVNQFLPVNVGANVFLYNEYEYTITSAVVNPQVNGSWTEIQDGVILSDVNSANTTFSNLQPGGNYFVWTQVLPCQTIRDRFMIFVHDHIEPNLPASITVTQFNEVLDNCSDEDDLPISSFSSSCPVNVETTVTSSPIQYCEVEDASDQGSCLYSSPWSMAFFAGFNSTYRYSQKIDLRLLQHPGGDIQLKGTVHLWNRPQAIFEVDAWFYNAKTWTEWSNQWSLSSFKADCSGIAGNHPDWMYYMMAYGKLIGRGELEGTVLNLVHAPSNFFFGFQMGEGANNVSSGYGFGGWFNVTGQLVDIPLNVNQSVSGAGDFAVEMNCCSGQSYDVNYNVTDECGNIGTWHDQFEVNDATPPVLTDTPPTILSCETLDWTGTWQDACSEVSINVIPNYLSVEDGNDVYTAFITATDACGNSSNYEFVQEVFDEACESLGCTQETAINFDPAAIIDDGSCLFEGCLDPNATNYDENASISAPCFYNPGIFVFHDLNMDGVYQEGEPGLEGFAVQWNNGAVYFYTNENGNVETEFAEGEHEFFLVLNDMTWTNTTPLLVSYTSAEPVQVMFGLRLSDLAENTSYEVFFDLSGVAFCEHSTIAGAVIHNSGTESIFIQANVTMSSEIQISTDVLAEFPGMQTDNSVSWNSVEVVPGDWINLYALIPEQGIASAGVTAQGEISIQVMDEANSLLEELNASEVFTVFCEENAVTMQVEPIGYSTEHFILAGDQLHYKVTFFNQGNNVIQNVKVEDFLEEEIYDLSTLQPVVASDLSLFCLHDDGMIDLFFNDINLAPGATGYAIYAVNVREDLTPGTLVLNDANVVFEEAQTTATNSVFNTIFDCDVFLDIVAQEELCLGDAISISMIQPYVESYAWYIDEVLVSNSSELLFDEFVLGENTISVTVENPLCSKTLYHTVNVNPQPGDQIVWDEGTEALQAPDGNAWVWYYEGFLIEGANDQFYSDVMKGSYTVVVTNEWGCTQESEPFVITSSTAAIGDKLRLYPNPANEFARVELPEGVWEVVVVDISGKRVTASRKMQGNSMLDLSELSAGSYVVQIRGESDYFAIPLQKLFGEK